MNLSKNHTNKGKKVFYNSKIKDFMIQEFNQKKYKIVRYLRNQKLVREFILKIIQFPLKVKPRKIRIITIFKIIKARF